MLRSIPKSIFAPTAVLSAACLYCHLPINKKSLCGTSADSYDDLDPILHAFPKRFTPNVPARPKAASMVIIGVGRVEKLPGCMVAVGVGPYSLDRAREWLREEKHHAHRRYFTLVDHLLKRENIITPYSITNPVKIGVVLKFERSVPADQLLDALIQPLAFVHDEPRKNFINMLRSAVGDAEYLRRGEEIAFYWFDSGNLLILHDGDLTSGINNPEINRALLEGFIDDRKTMSRELCERIKLMLPEVGYP